MFKPNLPITLLKTHTVDTNMGVISQKLSLRHILRRDIVLTILSFLGGWGISHVYYLKALNDVKADAEEQQRVQELVLRGIESIGTIKYSRDSSGKVVGVVVELRASGSVSAAATAGLSGIPASNAK
jgi:hypothetical protein